MSTTKTAALTLEAAMNTGDPQPMSAAMERAAHGSMHQAIRVAVVGVSSAAAQDITSYVASASAGFAIKRGNTGLTKLPPIGSVKSLRITAGTAHVLPCVVTDKDDTPTDPASGISVATISDDGKTLTFGAAVTAFVLEYFPAPAQDLAANNLAQ